MNADTNFLSRLYLRLTEIEETVRLVEKAQAEASPPLPVNWLHRFESINAFQLHDFAGKVRGQTRVTLEQAAAAQATFRADLAHPTFVRPVQFGLPELEAQPGPSEKTLFSPLPADEIGALLSRQSRSIR